MQQSPCRSSCPGVCVGKLPYCTATRQQLAAARSACAPTVQMLTAATTVVWCACATQPSHSLPSPLCGAASTYVAARSAAETANLLLCRPHPFLCVLSPHTVLIKKASFNWKSLASQNPRRGRNTRRTARKASATDPADTQQSAQQAAAVADSTTDGTVAAAAGAGSSGSSNVGIASQRAALRAAAAAGMPTSTASRMRVANPELAAAAGSGTAAVGTAATPAAGSTGATAAAPAAASAGTTAKTAEAAYDKSGLADAKFLLPVGPEVSGQLASRDTSPALSNCMCMCNALCLHSLLRWHASIACLLLHSALLLSS